MFRWSELGRDGEFGKVEKCLLHGVELFFELSGLRRERDRRRAWPDSVQRCVQKVATVAGVGDAVGRNQCFCFAVAKSVTLHGGHHSILLLHGQRAQLVGERGADSAPGQLLGAGLGQSRPYCDAPGDPRAAATQPLGNGGFTETVVALE